MDVTMSHKYSYKQKACNIKEDSQENISRIYSREHFQFFAVNYLIHNFYYMSKE